VYDRVHVCLTIPTCLAIMSDPWPHSPSLLADSSSHERRRSPRGHHRGGPPPAVDATAAPAGTPVAAVGLAAIAEAATTPAGIAAANRHAGTAAALAAILAPAAAPVAIAAANRRAGTAAGRATAATGTVAGRAGTAASRNRGQKYYKDEIDGLLDRIEDILPIGPQEWDDVSEAHTDRFPLKNRDTISLRRKFNEFVNSKKPTGDPNCPPHIKRAKDIQRMIIAKSDSGSGMLNDDEIGFDDEEATAIEPQNLMQAIDNTTTTSETTPSETATLSIRPMVTPRRRFESGGNSTGNNIGSLVDIMVTSMLERQQNESRQREEQRREREEQLREREERRLEQLEERELRREERKAEQEEIRRQHQAELEERRLDRAQQQAQQLAQQQQQTMLMMMIFGDKKKERDNIARDVKE
jgi:hypothetical protein